MNQSTFSYTPEYLGKRSTGPISKVDRIPWTGGSIEVELSCDEFTSLCPVTAQPDFGTVVVRFSPRKWLVESKSLKLYLWQYRERGVFSETLVAGIADDLFAQLEPEWLEVEGTFKSRGGISIHAKARRTAD